MMRALTVGKVAGTTVILYITSDLQMRKLISNEPAAIKNKCFPKFLNL